MELTSIPLTTTFCQPITLDMLILLLKSISIKLTTSTLKLFHIMIPISLIVKIKLISIPKLDQLSVTLKNVETQELKKLHKVQEISLEF